MAAGDVDYIRVSSLSFGAQGTEEMVDGRVVRTVRQSET
jgi:hypothetical protein